MKSIKLSLLKLLATLFFVIPAFASEDCMQYLKLGKTVRPSSDTDSLSTLFYLSSQGRHFVSPDGQWIVVNERPQLISEPRSQWFLYNIVSGQSVRLGIESQDSNGNESYVHTTDQVHFYPDYFAVNLFDEEFQATYVFNYDSELIAPPWIEKSDYKHPLTERVFKGRGYSLDLNFVKILSAHGEIEHKISASEVKPHPLKQPTQFLSDRPENHRFTYLSLALSDRDSILVGLKPNEKKSKLWLTEIMRSGESRILATLDEEIDSKNLIYDSKTSSLMMVQYAKTSKENWSKFVRLDLSGKLKTQEMKIEGFWTLADYREGRLTITAPKLNSQCGQLRVYQDLKPKFETALAQEDCPFAGKNKFIHVDHDRFIVQGERGDFFSLMDIKNTHLKVLKGHIVAYCEKQKRLLVSGVSATKTAWSFAASSELSVLDFEGNILRTFDTESLNLGRKEDLQFLNENTLVVRERGVELQIGDDPKSIRRKDPIRLLRW